MGINEQIAEAYAAMQAATAAYRDLLMKRREALNTDQLIADYLAKGGTITKVPFGEVGYVDENIRYASDGKHARKVNAFVGSQRADEFSDTKRRGTKQIVEKVQRSKPQLFSFDGSL